MHYCNGRFYQVNDRRFEKLKYIENNSFYRNYNKAINTIIPAYFIYPGNLEANILNELDSIEVDSFEEINSDSKKILNSKIRKSTTYREMFFQKVELPINYI